MADPARSNSARSAITSRSSAGRCQSQHFSRNIGTAAIVQMTHQAHAAKSSGNRVGGRAAYDVGAGEVTRGHQHGAASRGHRGKYRVDIFGGCQRDVGQNRANRSRAPGNQLRGAERDGDVEAARKFLVDERAHPPIGPSPAGLGQTSPLQRGRQRWRRARRPARRETSPRPAHGARPAAGQAKAESWRIGVAWRQSG